MTELDEARSWLLQKQNGLRVLRSWHGSTQGNVRSNICAAIRRAEHDLLDALDTLWGVQHRYEATRALSKSEMLVRDARPMGRGAPHP